MDHSETREHDPEQEKRVRFEAMCEGEPNALYLLSGVSEVVDPETQQRRYKPGSYADVDWKGYMSGGKARALAVAELAKYFPEATVAVNSSTFSVQNPEAPTDAEVMAEYAQRKGVDPERIIRQDRSTTTFTELVELVKYIAKNGWQHAVVVVGETQKPRAEEMLRQIDILHDPAGAWKDEEFRAALEVFRELHPQITFVTAEDVLPLRDERFGRLIAEARKTENWKTREALDAKALEDLKSGRYWQ